MKHIVIIGNGIAGITAARYIRKMSDAAITIISAESKYFFSRTALMYVYMGHETVKDIQPYEDFFWDKNRFTLIQAFVQQVNTEAKTLQLSNGKHEHYDTLIIASGSTFNRFGWPGQDLRGVGGLYSLQDLEYLETYSRDTQHAVIVGGGLIGIELAEMFASRNIGVSFLVRESSYWNNVIPAEESAMVNRHIKEHHIDLRLSTELKEILSDDSGRVRAVRTSDGKEIACQFVGLTAGVKPNIDFLRGSGIQLNRGIIINEYFETSVPDVYAIGDCAEFSQPLPLRKNIEQVWYTGKMHGETVALNVLGRRRAYTPGNWFNSAKFLDIEYQVYGEIPPYDLPPEVDTLYWEHTDGRKSIRINYNKSDGIVQGFNLMGIRYRHKVCDKWLSEKRDIRYVMAHLPAANFDPEFFTRYESQVLDLFNKKHPQLATSFASKSAIKAMVFAG